MSKTTSTEATLSDTITPINREHWLTLLGTELEAVIQDRTGLTPAKYRIACGFPSSRARATKNATIGECHYRNGKGFMEIFIHPKLDDAIEVAGVALHEMLHAALPIGTGHKAPFAKAAVACGLDGKPTATTVGEDLRYELAAIVAKLGDYPHESLSAQGKKQPTRLLKAFCPECGYTVRVTQKWIDEAGNAVCPACDEPFVNDSGNGGQRDPLVAIDHSVEFKVRPVKTDPKLPTIYDARWSLRMNKRGRVTEWFVIDYGTAILGVELPRLTPAPSREDALALLNGLREGMITYEDLTDEGDIDGWEDDETDEWDEREAGIFVPDSPELDDDEDETPDNPDEQIDPADEAEFQRTQAIRERIAVGDRSDRKPEGMEQERELGSMQYRFKV
jgi:hypothetical protein